MTWLEAFLWTCAIEQPVYAFALRGVYTDWRAACAISLLLNSVTHPLLWWATKSTGPGEVAAAEAVVFVVEALVLRLILSRRLKTWPAWRLALGASLTANAASWLGGLALNAYWPR